MCVRERERECVCETERECVWEREREEYGVILVSKLTHARKRLFESVNFVCTLNFSSCERKFNNCERRD